jgi:hypothetical protein
MSQEPAPVIRRTGDEIELVELHWGLKPRSPGERQMEGIAAAKEAGVYSVHKGRKPSIDPAQVQRLAAEG